MWSKTWKPIKNLCCFHWGIVIFSDKTVKKHKNVISSTLFLEVQILWRPENCSFFWTSWNKHLIILFKKINWLDCDNWNIFRGDEEIDKASNVKSLSFTGKREEREEERVDDEIGLIQCNGLLCFTHRISTSNKFNSV